MHIKIYNVQIGFGHRIIANIHLFSVLTLPWLRSVVATSQSPGPRTNHCSVVIGNFMFIFGGTADNNFSYFSKVSLPFNSTSQWSSLTMTGAVQVSKPACIVTQDNKLLVIGGTALMKSSDTFSYLQLYDPDTQTWSEQYTNALFPFRSMQGHVAVTTKKSIFVFNGNGGLDPTYLLQSVGKNSWDVIQYPQQQFSPPSNLIYPSATDVSTSTNNRVFIIGGKLQNGNISTGIYAFDVESTSWLPQNKSVRPTCANCTVFATNNGKVIDVISPGSPYPVQSLPLSQDQFPDVLAVNLVNSTVPQPKTSSSFPVPLEGYSAVIFNQSVYIYGGIAANGSNSDTLYQFDTLTNVWSIPAENLINNGNSNTNNNGYGSVNPNSPQYTTGSSTSSKLALIFGCGIGILAFIALVGLIIYWLRVKRTRNAQYLASIDSRHISSATLDGYTLGKGRGLDGNANDVAFVSRLIKRLSLLNKKNAANLASSEDTEQLQSSAEEGSLNNGHLGDDTNDNGSVSSPAMLERTGGGVPEWGDAVGFDIETFSTPGTTAVTILPKNP